MNSDRSVFSGRNLIVAFEGWNDAADAASSVVKLIAEQMAGEVVGALDPEEYFDFQFNRPIVSYDEAGQRQFTWPGADFFEASDEAKAANPKLENLFVLIGVEPSRRWKAFVSEIIEVIQDLEIDAVVFLGAMLADQPHTRPILVTSASQNPRVCRELGVEKSSYEGPVGILSVLGQALEDVGIPTVSMWAQVPHYVHQQPAPKATLALLTELEQLLGISFDHGSLGQDAFTWERGIDDVASEDSEMASYIQQLEETRDELGSEAASGEALAREFERFLNSEQKDQEPKIEDGNSSGEADSASSDEKP